MTYAYNLNTRSIIFYFSNENKLEYCKDVIYSKEGEIINDYGNNDQELKPKWVTGFEDGEGAFMINISKCYRTKLGYSFRGIFQITVHRDDKFILEKVKKFFKNVGHIKKISHYFTYKVDSFDELIKVIIPHFEEYPLLSLSKNKPKNFFLFKNCLELITKNKRNITTDILKQILRFKICFKLGTKAKVFSQYPDILPFNNNNIPIPLYNNIEPDWLSGFVAADGRISQDKVDEKLMLDIHKYLGTGSVSKTKKGMINYSISSILDINKIVIPFFNKYKLRTSKEIDFYYFVKIINIVNEKGYGKKWTFEDQKKILYFTSKMNNGRRKFPQSF